MERLSTDERLCVDWRAELHEHIWLKLLRYERHSHSKRYGNGK